MRQLRIQLTCAQRVVHEQSSSLKVNAARLDSIESHEDSLGDAGSMDITADSDDIASLLQRRDCLREQTHQKNLQLLNAIRQLRQLQMILRLNASIAVPPPI
mmetsp:Transcript_23724/g.59379  ORF Transcript_23724/g.59379 Transcript_23724/m.59379 type:complete len:102 (-) Transcript_23724:41-346(-)